MADVTIRMRPNGPFLVEGPFKLLDSQGREYKLDPAKPAYALCRCGHSAKKPFCDGAHKGCDFVSDEQAPEFGRYFIACGGNFKGAAIGGGNALALCPCLDLRCT